MISLLLVSSCARKRCPGCLGLRHMGVEALVGVLEGAVVYRRPVEQTAVNLSPTLLLSVFREATAGDNAIIKKFYPRTLLAGGGRALGQHRTSWRNRVRTRANPPKMIFNPRDVAADPSIHRGRVGALAP